MDRFFRRHFLIVLLGLVSFNLFAQSNADSIKRVKRKQLISKGKEYLFATGKAYGQGETNNALVYIDSAYHLFKTTNDHYNLVNALLNRAKINYDLGRNEPFKKDALEAIKIADIHLSDTLLNYGAVLNVMALYSKIIGDYESAQGYYDRAIKIFQRYFDRAEEGKLKNYYARILTAGITNKGIIFRDKKDFEESKRYFRKVLATIDPIKDEMIKSRAIAMKELAISEWLCGNEEEALNFYNKSLGVIEQAPNKSDKYFQTIKLYNLQGIARIWMDRGMPKEAEPFIYESVDITENNEVSFDAFVSYTLLGDLLLEQGKYEQAESVYQLGLDSAKSEFRIAQSHPDIANCYGNLGKLRHKKGDLLGSLEFYQQALVFASKNFNSQNLHENPLPKDFIVKYDGVNILKCKGEVFLELFENTTDEVYLINAYQAFHSAVALIQNTRQQFNASKSKLFLAENSVAIFEKAIETALGLYEFKKDKKYLDAVFTLIEQNKARVLLESLASQEALKAGGLPDSLVESEKSLKQDLTFYKQKLIENAQSGNTDKDATTTINNIIFDLEEKYQLLQSEFAKNYPNYFNIKYDIKQASVNELQHAYLDDNSAIIEFFFGVEHIYIYLLLKKEASVYCVKNSPQLKRKIEDLLTSLRIAPSGRGGAMSVFVDNAHYLYKELLEELIEALPQEINRLVIIPDDVLSLLPMELLVSEKVDTLNSFREIPYLFRNYKFSYNYSTALLLNNYLNGGKFKKSGVLGFAPTFQEKEAGLQRSCTENNLYSLKCSDAEVREINQLIAGELYTGKTASKNNFLNIAPDYQMLHLATHACTDEDIPMLNRIWFSDGSITNFELFNLQLNADLVVLSACNTGSGKILKGEGVQSLARGFLHAGCRSLITSLWSVDDCATSEIMTYVYGELKKGKDKDEALREAKLKYLNTAAKLQQHPYYWGAFVQVGNYDQIIFNKRNKLFIKILMALVLVGVLQFFLGKVAKTN
ncbi:MAG: CHAT domain-containing protein [Bacteroidota bacterium]